MISGRRFLLLVLAPIFVVVLAFAASYFWLISKEKADNIARSSFDEILKSKNWKRSDFVGPTFSSDPSNLRWRYCWRRITSREIACVDIERRPLEVTAFLRSSDLAPIEQLPLNW